MRLHEIRNQVPWSSRVPRRNKPDPKAVAKLRDWEIPRNKTEMESFLGFANYYHEFIPWHAKLVAPLHAITGLKATFAWGSEQQLAFNEIKKHSLMLRPSRSQTLKVTLYWIPIPVQLQYRTFSISGKAHPEKNAYAPSCTAARNLLPPKPNMEHRS